ncbi:MAG TPA: hypothetical protein VK868_04270, partial [Pyrinomonadaceae bacterium]|nr:hypothetical protein [Pyrinomonadaceae bacterium]
MEMEICVLFLKLSCKEWDASIGLYKAGIEQVRKILTTLTKNKSGRGACPRRWLDWTSGGKPL